MKGIMPERTDARGVELLRIIQRLIIEEPKRFEIRLDQAFEGRNPAQIAVHQLGRLKTKRLEFPACGTVACVAGWADILVNGPQRDDYRGWGTIEQASNRALRMADAQTKFLYHIHNWPKEFKTRYIKANRVRRGKIAANYIEFFIANRHLLTGGWRDTTDYYAAATAHFAK